MRLDLTQHFIKANKETTQPFARSVLVVIFNRLWILFEQLANGDIIRIARDRFQRGQHEQRRDDGARPIGHFINRNREPVGHHHDFDGHDGAGFPRRLAEQAQGVACKYVRALCAACCEYKLTCISHMRRVNIFACEFQRIIAFNGGRYIHVAFVKQRPAPIRVLDAAQINANLLLKLRVYFVHIMHEHDIFGRDSRVGFQFKQPMAIIILALCEAVSRGLNQRFKLTLKLNVCFFFYRNAHARTPMSNFVCNLSVLRRVFTSHLCAICAAVKPERMAPSIVAGRPVSVQSPARNRLS